jgi:dephospho-CoA kinase
MHRSSIINPHIITLLRALLCKQALGNIVFSSKTEMQKLEGIVWPEIKRLIDIDLSALKEVRAQ